MHIAIVLAVVLGALGALPSASDAGERGAWRFEARPYRVLPFPYVPYAVAPSGNVPAPLVVVPSHRGPWRRGPFPWRYHPDPHCLPPYCLPSYFRPVFPPPRTILHPLPVAAVLQRLKRLDYVASGPVVLQGANYRIEAVNRHGQVVLLIVNAGTGQIRKLVR